MYFVQVIQLMKKNILQNERNILHKLLVFFFVPPNFCQFWIVSPTLGNNSAKPSLGSQTVSDFGSRLWNPEKKWIPWDLRKSGFPNLHRDTVLLNQLELPAMEYKLGLAPSHCEASICRFETVETAQRITMMLGRFTFSRVLF